MIHRKFNSHEWSELKLSLNNCTLTHKRSQYVGTNGQHYKLQSDIVFAFTYLLIFVHSSGSFVDLEMTAYLCFCQYSYCEIFVFYSEISELRTYFFIVTRHSDGNMTDDTIKNIGDHRITNIHLYCRHIGLMKWVFRLWMKNFMLL